MNEYQTLSSSEDPIITAEIVPDSGHCNDNSSSASPDWFNVSRRLQQQNQELLQTVLRLEQSLQESQEKLQIQNRRLRGAETLANQQNHEMNQNQQQVSTLMQELEACKQKIAQQNNLLNQYSQEIKVSREKIAQLEKNQFSLIEKQQENQQKLLTSQQHIKELRTRLQRQQRYTVQYKAALDQCLGKGGEVAASNVIPIVTVQPWSSVEEKPENKIVSATTEISVESTQIVQQEAAPKFSPSPKLTDWTPRSPKLVNKSARKIELPSFLN